MYTHLFIPSPMPPTITPSYSSRTSNRIHFPWRAGLAPESCSWSLSEHLGLTAYKWVWPLVNRTHTDFLHNRKWSAVVTSVMRRTFAGPSAFRDIDRVCRSAHWCLISHSLTSRPVVSPLTPEVCKNTENPTLYRPTHTTFHSSYPVICAPCNTHINTLNHLNTHRKSITLFTVMPHAIVSSDSTVAWALLELLSLHLWHGPTAPPDIRFTQTPEQLPTRCCCFAVDEKFIRKNPDAAWSHKYLSVS